MSKQLTVFTRTPVVVVRVVMDYCNCVFGQAPCEATGKYCYNTFPTCRDRLHYDKGERVYMFSSADTPLPFPGENIRPYVLGVDYIPTEIKDNFTVSGRVNITLADEMDTDIGVDPYLDERATVQGTFWKKFIARNRNYRGRMVEVYEGFLGDEWVDFEKRFVGTIENISINGAEIRLQVVDLLKTLAEVEVPKKIDCKLVTDISEDVENITLSAVDELEGSGYVLIGDELIQYVCADAVTNEIHGCTRGALGTVAATHRVKDKVGKVRYYAAANPFDILLEMLTVDAGLAEDFINIAEFGYWRDWPDKDIRFSGVIAEPTKLSELYYEIVDLLDAKSWIAENWQITIRKKLPNQPGREYLTVRDDLNILDESAEVDLNESSRYTRVLVYWDKNVLGKISDVKEYARLDIAIEVDAESVNGYGDTIEKQFFCRWIAPGLEQDEILFRYIRNFIARRLFRVRDAAPILNCAVEIKDSGMLTGDWALVTTNELAEVGGEDYRSIAFQIIKRERSNNKIALSLIKLHPRRLCFITPNGYPVFAEASLHQREYGFISQNNGMMDDDNEGYHIY